MQEMGAALELLKITKVLSELLDFYLSLSVFCLN